MEVPAIIIVLYRECLIVYGRILLGRLRTRSTPLFCARARVHARENRRIQATTQFARVHNDNSFSWQRLATARDVVNGLNGESVSIESWKLTWRWAGRGRRVGRWRLRGPFRYCVSVPDGTDYNRRSKLDSMGGSCVSRA